MASLSSSFEEKERQWLRGEEVEPSLDFRGKAETSKTAGLRI